MEEFILESKNIALDIVSGESFDAFMFNDISDVVSQNKIKEMGKALSSKDNKLAMLSVEKLNILYNTLVSYENAAEKDAYNRVLEAIDFKVKSFVEGKEDLLGKDIEPMLTLIQKRTQDTKTISNPEMYNTALNKTVLAGQKYDAENGLSDITKDKINLVEANLKKMANWQVDVTNLDERPENNVINIPEEKFLEFMQKRINGKNNVSFADLQSALIAVDKYKKSDEIRDKIFLQAENKIKNCMKEKGTLAPSEVAPASFIYEILQKSIEKNKKNIKGFDVKIKKSIEKNKSIKVFETIDYIVKNTEVIGNPKLFGREIVKQTDGQGKLKKNSDIALWLEAVRNKTLCQLVTISGLTKDKFNEKFVDNVALEYMSLASVHNTLNGKNNRKSFKSLFAEMGKDKKIAISQGVIMGGVVNISNETDDFISRLSAKFDKTISGIEDLKEKTSKMLLSGKILGDLKNIALDLDEKCTKKWGDKYLMAKGFAKAVGKQSGWAMAFNVAKVVGVATQSSWVLPTVAAISFGNATYQFGKDYYQAKNEAKKKGKEFNFKDFCKKSKVRLGSLALSGMVTAATAGVFEANATSAILNSKVWVSGGLVACKIADKIAEDKKNNKTKAQIAIGACLTAVTATAGYIISSVAGKGAFDSSKGFVDTSVHDNIGAAVDSSIGASGKGKDRTAKKRKKAIEIIPMKMGKVAGNVDERINAAQVMMNKFKNQGK